MASPSRSRKPNGKVSLDVDGLLAMMKIKRLCFMNIACDTVLRTVAIPAENHPAQRQDLDPHEKPTSDQPSYVSQPTSWRSTCGHDIRTSQSGTAVNLLAQKVLRCYRSSSPCVFPHKGLAFEGRFLRDLANVRASSGITKLLQRIGVLNGPSEGPRRQWPGSKERRRNSSSKAALSRLPAGSVLVRLGLNMCLCLCVCVL